MISEHFPDTAAIIKERKSPQYSAIDKQIFIPSKNATTFYDVCAALHETGHYITHSSDHILRRTMLLTAVLRGIWLLAVIPALIVLFLFFHQFAEGPVYWLLNAFFLAAVSLHLSVGMYGEIQASRCALQHLKKIQTEPRHMKLAKQCYLTGFLTQLLPSLLVTTFWLSAIFH